MTRAEEKRLEGLLTGLLVGIHAAGAVYRWIRGEKKETALHGSYLLVEGMAVWRHLRDE